MLLIVFRPLLTRARGELESAGEVPDDSLELDPDRSHTGSVVQLWARYMIETRGADEDVGGWKFEFGGAYDPANSMVTRNAGDCTCQVDRVKPR